MTVGFTSLFGKFLGINQATGDLVDGDSNPLVRAAENRLVTLAVSTTITREAHDGKTILMSGAGAARTFTLPAASGTGAKFKFRVSAVNTSNYLIKVANATDVMDGGVIFMTDTATDVVNSFECASTTDTITLNGTTTGGVSIGDWVELEDIASGQWVVTGILTASGTEATPFSATVS